MEKQKARPPTRISLSWLCGDGVCIVCRKEDALVTLQDVILQNEDGSGENISIGDLIYETFHMEVTDEYKCGELCSSCLGRLKDAELFRKQVLAASEAQKEIDTSDNINHAGNTKRTLFSSSEKRQSSQPPKLDKNAKECPICGATGMDFFHLRAHYTRHFLNLICETCGRGFYHQKSLDIHMTQHAEKMLTCNFCNKDYATKFALSQHIKTVHDRVKMYPCKRCSKTFSSSTTRMKHMWDEHGVPCRMYQCEQCPRTFYTTQRRDLHNKRMHLQIKDHECEWCDFACVSATELINHKTKHSNERNFNCDECGKLFKNKRSLKEHSKTHQIIAEPSSERVFEEHSMGLDESDSINVDNLDPISFITL